MEEDAGMLIQVTPADRESLLELIPGDEWSAELVGTEVEGPPGVTVRYNGRIELRSVDAGPILEFIVQASSTGASLIVIAEWIAKRFRGRARANKITIDYTQVDLDDEGNVRRVVEEAIKIREK